MIPRHPKMVFGNRAANRVGYVARDNPSPVEKEIPVETRLKAEK
jgi:hypothetical protein